MPTQLISEEEMLRQVLDATPCLPGRQRLRLREAANRIAAAEITSPLSIPAAPLSTMDGFAARKKELPAKMAVAGKSDAGAPWAMPVAEGSCLAVATGAWVPPELDIVIPKEDTQAKDGRVNLPSADGRQACIRPAASELATGAVVLRRGERITSRKLSLLASLGIDRVAAFPKPRVGVLASGDELRQPGEQLGPGAIYDANRPQVLALLRRHGCEAVDLGVARDDLDSMQAALRDGMTCCDAIVTIGGASVGERDFLKETVSSLGTISAWKVALKPGKPFALGKLGKPGKVPLFGLPGNPASVFVTFVCLVLPALWRMSGLDPLPSTPWAKARASTDLAKEVGRTDYQRGVLSVEDGQWQVGLAGPQGSGSLPVLAAANCLIRLPRESAGVASGEIVDVLPLDTLD